MLPAVQKRGASRSSRLSFGEKTLFLYFLVFYFFPIGMDFFSDVQLKYFLRGDLPFTLPFAFAAFYLFTILSLRRIIDIDIKIKAPLRKVIPSKIILYAVFSIFLVVLSLSGFLSRIALIKTFAVFFLPTPFGPENK